MAQRRTNQRSKQGGVDSLKKQVEKATGRDGKGAVWVRESDGAICVGDECITFKPRKSGGVNIEIDPTVCGAEVGEAIVERFAKGVGREVNLHIKRPLPEDDDD